MEYFKIHDGRAAFWQWDLDRRLQVGDDVCGEVHFCNGAGDVALVCQIYEMDGQRVVDVPNILLQTGKSFTVYAFVRSDSGGYTRRAVRFPVRPRTKPADYVYTETEVLSYEALEKRVAKLEEGGGYSPGGSGGTSTPGADGGYYTPEITQPDGSTMAVAYIPSADTMPAVDPVRVTLPAGPAGPQGEKGEAGQDYVLTDADKQEIAEKAAKLVEVPDSSQNGEDGFSLIATVEQTTDGAVITITDKDGTTTATITNGKDGKDGADGQPGADGKDGADGKTPVRGVDYWTDADKAEIKAYVDEAILGGAW